MKYIKLYNESKDTRHPSLTLTQEDFEDYFLELKDIGYTIESNDLYLKKEGSKWSPAGYAEIYDWIDDSDIYVGYEVSISGDEEDDDHEGRGDEEEIEDDDYEEFDEDIEEDEVYFNRISVPVENIKSKCQEFTNKLNYKIEKYQNKIDAIKKEQNKINTFYSILSQAAKRINYIEGEVQVNFHSEDDVRIFVIPKNSKPINYKKVKKPNTSTWGRHPSDL